MGERKEEVYAVAEKSGEEGLRSASQSASGIERKFVTDNGLSIKPVYKPEDLI